MSQLDNFGLAVRQRNTVLFEMLQPGIPEAKIRKKLEKCGLTKSIKNVVDLYSWRNGFKLFDRRVSGAERVIFPCSNFSFEDLDLMSAHFLQFREFCKNNSRYCEVADKYFPIFWDGSTGWIAVDISKGDGVVLIDGKLNQPVRLIYDSFESFLSAAIVSNERCAPLDCLC
ncbi:MAG: hypothetical protein ACO1QS_18255 [Verrucomicrobiota bacterium]